MAVLKVTDCNLTKIKENTRFGFDYIKHPFPSLA